MRMMALVWSAIFIATVTSSCATQSSLYRSWGNQFADAAAKNLTKDDISLMLGAEPYNCKSVSATPMLGILLEDASGPTVRGIDPNGPAANINIKIGDKIISVNSQLTNSTKEVVDSIRAIASPDHPITIKTQRGSYALTPKYPTEVKQCYWDIIAGKVGKVAESAYVDQYAGSAVQGGTSYQRFFAPLVALQMGEHQFVSLTGKNEIS